MRPHTVTLVALVALSAAPSAQTASEQMDPVLRVDGSPGISGSIGNLCGPADLPPAYFPQDTSVTLYIGASFFATTTGEPRGVVYFNPGVTAQAVVGLRADGTEALGCTGPLQTDPTDIANDITGRTVLIRRGRCAFAYKADNAQDAGAVGVVVYNGSDRVGPDPTTGDVIANMSSPDDAEFVNIPVVLVPNGIGQPIVDEARSATVSLTIRSAAKVTRPSDVPGAITGERARGACWTAAEPTAGTTASGLEVRGANPFTFSTDLRVFTERAEAVRVDVFNVRGQLVSTLFNGAVAGERAVAFSSADLAAGAYFVRATGETFKAQQQVTVVR